MPRPSRRERRIHRLVAEVCSLGRDPHAWTDRLMRGLVELFDARMSALAWAEPARPPRRL